MNEPTINSAIPGAISHKLGLVRQRKMMVHVASAIVAALAVLLVAMGVAMLIDWLATLYDSRWRVVLTLVAFLAAGLTTLGWLGMIWRRGLRWGQLAADVDARFPVLEERWTTVTELRPEDASNPKMVHPAMLRRVAAEAARWEPNVEPDQVVSLSPLMKTMFALTAITAALAAAVVFDSRQTLVLIRRFWLPASSISATELVNVPGNKVIGRGEPFALEAQVKGTPVDRALLFLRDGKDETRSISLVAHGQEPIEFSHRMRSVEEPFAYRFRAGDGQTEWFNVEVADRPEIDKIQLTITPPEYTKRESKSFDKLPQRVSAIEHSEMELAIRPDRPVTTVELKMADDKSVKLTADADGWYRWKTQLDDGFSLTPILTESHGLTNRKAPKCQVSVYPDRPPVVKVISPDDQMEVRPDDKVQITFTAQDDVGIGSAEMLIYDESAPPADGQLPVPIATIPIPLADQAGARSVQQSVDLNMNELGFKDGSEFSYEIRVREDRGDSPGAQVASTQQPTTPANQPATNQVAMNQPTNAPATNQVAMTSPSTPPSTNSAAPQQSPTSPSANQIASASPASASPITPNSNGASPESSMSPSSATAQASPSPSGAPSEQQTAQASNSPRPGESASPGSQTTVESKSPSVESQTAKPGESTARVASNAANPLDEAPAKDGAAESMKSDSTARVASREAPAAEKPATGETSVSPPKAEGLANNSPGSSNKSPAGSDPTKPANEPTSPSNSSPADEENKLANNQPVNPGSQPDKSAGSPESNQTAKSALPKDGEPKNMQAPAEPGAARTATSARRAISSRPEDKNSEENAAESMAGQSNPQNGSPNSPSSQAANNPQSPNSNQSAASSGNNQQMAEKNEPGEVKDQQANNRSEQSPNPSQMASSSSNNSNFQPSDSDRPPGDSMTRRKLDVTPPQEGASKRMKLKVDEWAGSFEGQQRAKMEMAIAPELEALDQALAKAERTARGTLDDLGKSGTWQGRHDRDVSIAEKSTVEGQQVITRLQEKSKETPYAFIGLQAADIGLAHVNPARSGFWKALQAEGGDRVGSVRDAAQHLTRAREMVAQLKGQFERAKKEYQLAESVEHVKKMYRVYIENTQALLQTQADDPTRYNRKRAEFDLDEEYMARLQEVLEMRRDLQAELARILGDDPRLLRRFMDSLKNRTHSLREDLADLVARQEDLNREVRAWTLVDEAERPRIAKILLLRQVQDSGQIATAAGELQSRYQAWLPLNRESKDADLAAATERIQKVATAATELGASAKSFVDEAQKPTVAVAQPQAEAAPADATAKPQAAPTDVAPLVAKGQQLYNELNGLEVAFRQLAAREEAGAETAGFAANRLVETRRLIADTSAWIRQLRAHQAGTYARAAEVDQYRLAMKTDELAGKLGAIEQTLAGLMQRSDGTLPEAIAQKAREFITTLDKQASPNQLASVYALHSDQMSRAVERQKAAGDALTRAEKQYDELVKMAIEELDKLPVQDPIASLLDDPTLDELLAQLEQEVPVRELLGIPQRPSNLQIIGDWLNNRSDGGVAAGGGRQMMMNQFRQDQQQAQRKLDQAYRRAIARALKEVKVKPIPPEAIPKTATLSDWNQLVSKLGDDLRQGRDKAPPEQYRRAIEQYFAQISSVVAEQEKNDK